MKRKICAHLVLLSAAAVLVACQSTPTYFCPGEDIIYSLGSIIKKQHFRM